MKRISCVISAPRRACAPSSIMRVPASSSMIPCRSFPLRRMATIPSSSSSSSSSSHHVPRARSAVATAATSAAIGTAVTIATITIAAAATAANAAAATTSNDTHDDDEDQDDEVNEARVARTISAASEDGQPRLTPEQAKKLITERLLQFAASAEAGDPDSQVSCQRTISLIMMLILHYIGLSSID